MKYALLATEVGMGLYWILAGLMATSLVSIPAEFMYSDYTNPLIVAWNWSFLPIDLIFVFCGLAALFSADNDERRKTLRLIGLTAMFCSGLMAISYWAILATFDPAWWGVNIWLMVLPVIAHFSGASTKV